MSKSNIKFIFSVKTKEELKELSLDELLKYTEGLTDYCYDIMKPKKNSNNSNIPPSVEITPPAKNKKNQSLREPSERKSGGQVGHDGKTLEQTTTPDEIINIPFTLTVCKKCNSSLEDTIEQLKERRQVLDLELSSIETKITQYQSYSKICPVCNYENHDNAFPFGVSSNISYGANIKAIVSYFSVSQYMSHSRTVGALKDLFNVAISEGSVAGLLRQTTQYAAAEIDKIIEALNSSNIIGIDETGCKINGEKHWHWAFQDSNNTLIIANKSRGSKVITETFPNGLINAVVNHDNYSSYSSLECKNEQLCLAHKLRDLNYAIECDNSQVMKDIKLLLQEAMTDHKLELTSQQRITLKQEYEKSLDDLLIQPALPKSETQKQLKSLTKAKEKIFVFLLDENIPPDNNGSERAIRNVKVKQKVSGQFKSFDGAQQYAVLRSIIDTSRKRGMNEFQTLKNVSSGLPVF